MSVETVSARPILSAPNGRQKRFKRIVQHLVGRAGPAAQRVKQTGVHELNARLRRDIGLPPEEVLRPYWEIV